MRERPVNTSTRRRGRARRAALCAAAFLCAPLAVAGMGFGAGQGHVAAAALAAERGGMPERTPGAATGLPVPRFVSLKSGRANVRRGPGTDFPIDWVYRKSGMPLEVIAESSNWRRIRDHEGDGGWIWHSMLDGERSAIVDTADGAPVALHTEPAESAPVIAYAEKGIVARVKSCKARWCRLETRGYEGWILQETLWGVYPGEAFE